MNNRTIYFHGVQLAYKSTEKLIRLIDKEVKAVETRPANNNLEIGRNEKLSLLSLKKILKQHLFQWNNVELGDTVVYKEAVGK